MARDDLTSFTIIISSSRRRKQKQEREQHHVSALAFRSLIMLIVICIGPTCSVWSLVVELKQVAASIIATHHNKHRHHPSRTQTSNFYTITDRDKMAYEKIQVDGWIDRLPVLLSLLLQLILYHRIVPPIPSRFLQVTSYADIFSNLTISRFFTSYFLQYFTHLISF